MADKRKPLSKKIRFDTFKRDGFKCVYCGNNPPNVVLEADHIIPVKDGGINQLDNLVTSCFSCNRGKAANHLTSIPESIFDNSIDRLEQYKSYLKYVKEKDKLDKELIDIICMVYENYNEGYTPNESFRSSIAFFVNKIGFDKTKKAMEITMGNMKKIRGYNGVIKFFCGVCWNIYRDSQSKDIF
jgi:hypothetical protein